MKPTVLLKILGAEALPDAEGAFIEMETSEGPLELRCTYEDAERLIAALQAARAKVQDPVNQDALIRAVYPDRTTRETRIPRSEVRSIARALEQVAQRFDVSAEMRQ
jgi:hypothetical protein